MISITVPFTVKTTSKLLLPSLSGQKPITFIVQPPPTLERILNCDQTRFSKFITLLHWNTCAHALQWVTKKHMYLTPYVWNERIFDGLQFALNKIFLNKTLIRFVVYLITLHLVPFASQSINIWVALCVFEGSVKCAVLTFLKQYRS